MSGEAEWDTYCCGRDGDFISGNRFFLHCLLSSSGEIWVVAGEEEEEEEEETQMPQLQMQCYILFHLRFSCTFCPRQKEEAFPAAGRHARLSLAVSLADWLYGKLANGIMGRNAGSWNGNLETSSLSHKREFRRGSPS
jgi:hypothetical protein